MKAEDIKDRETLEAWLRGRPRRDSIVVAHRAALRVLPVWGAAMGEDWARESGLTALPLLRCGLISAVVAARSSVEINKEARAAALAADAAGANADGAISMTAANADAAAIAAANAAITTYASIAVSGAVRAADQANLVYDASTNISDVTLLEDGGDPINLDLWPNHPPERFLAKERVTLAIWDEDPPERWEFWRRWWEGAKRGQPLDPGLQLTIVKGIDEETWKDPDKVAEAIAKIEMAFVPPLSDAAFSDFRFDTVHQWMVLADFDDDLSHLRDPEVIRAFHEDCEDLRDQLQDFIDFAGDMAEGRNRPVPMVRSADKLLKEVQRAEGAERLRARRFVQLGQYAELHAAVEVDRSVVGETNARMLDDALETFRSVCRKHLGPVLRRLDPLDRFELGDSDPVELVKVLSGTVNALATAQVQGLKPLSPDAETALRELVEGLEDLKSQLTEAQSEERRSYLRRRFARNYAASAATVKRLTERMAPVAQGTTKAVDGAIKNHGRWKKLVEIVDWLSSLWS
ncbi:hypothetical protein [Mameliella alba]|uniref:hypothetical protein n=1 Tax=Mameliella alba TaxID=561184 RepID=UPI0010546F6C|nr:hypothetical protein [Mameliella alba]GGF42445.1 hypothetical protein GCM10011319_00270 [Mameliella alba]